MDVTKGVLPMAKPELGMKRVCVACNTRFYDLQKSPAICPKCGTEQPIDQPRPRRAGGNVVEDKRIKKPAPAGDDTDVDVEVDVGDDVEGDEDVLAETDDLEDDADAISGDIEVETDNDDNER
ncbi:TIGR02300 family protein [Rhodopila sp.]|uniref:TIGR02300 family protein n=1 Tax=Rhodopila sp. TaxID=2480087 RepID=UPI002CFF8898|nr:TIGR02300 family protein [Rhodopila sp.]HVZ09083.1 TIGR02300 family protein [Rhodopila sp.]